MSKHLNDELKTVRSFYGPKYLHGHDIEAQNVLKNTAVNYEGSSVKFADMRSNKALDLFVEANTFMLDEATVINAICCYCESICLLPVTHELFPLVTMDRGMALAEFGYFEAAMDDYQLVQMLSEDAQLKLTAIIRQANCAFKTGDILILRDNIKQLNKAKLDETQMEDLQTLKRYERFLTEFEQCEIKKKQLKKINNISALQNNIRSVGNGKVNTNSSCVLTCHKTDNMRYEDFLKERIYSFIPEFYQLVCSNCAILILIPFPCLICEARVLYCSLKCQLEHYKIHKHECCGYKMNVLSLLTMKERLAMRTTIMGLQTVLPYICNKKNANEIWDALTSKRSNLVKNNKTKRIHYIELLSLKCNKKNNVTQREVICVRFILSYLKDWTTFFKDLKKNSKASLNDWQLIVGALCLRHIRQYSVKYNLMMPNCEVFHSQYANIWKKAYSISRGYLHRFCKRDLYILTFTPLFETRDKYMAKNLFKKDEEILVSMLETKRICQSYEKETKQDCICDICTKSEIFDEDYPKRRIFRCERNACRGLFFVNIVVNAVVDKFFDKPNALGNICFCPHCKTRQHYKWFDNLKLLNPFEDDAIPAFAKSFIICQDYFIDCNILKYITLEHFVNVYFRSAINKNFKPDEYVVIAHLMKYFLDMIEIEFGILSQSYLAIMTILWDVIAMGHYIPTRQEMEKMMTIINFLSTKEREIFQNYFDDYVKDKVI